MTQCAYVGLGANLGAARTTLQASFSKLDALPQTNLVVHSSLYRTTPVDASGPDYINAVAELKTELSAHELLQQLQFIEQQHGRQRSQPGAPRTLDLDLLLYADEIIATPTLTVPHPRMHERAFVLVPMAELSPEAVIPGQGKVREWLAKVATHGVERLEPD